MPPRPTPAESAARKSLLQIATALDEDLQPYERIAADLRGAIDSGSLSPGDPRPTEKALAGWYGVAAR
ncbi:GntR family transcriptional regulator [Kribbella sp. NPDC050281]|uniref:GntR family transcriptional regulator n=1 Tax=Kribbella sp. NPDC050281 TaxID=3155515 RepID=UPI0034036AE6